MGEWQGCGGGGVREGWGRGVREGWTGGGGGVGGAESGVHTSKYDTVFDVYV